MILTCRNCNSYFKTTEKRLKCCSWDCHLMFRKNNPNLFQGGRFKKKQVPWNKGVRGYMGANKTSFKKGNIPPQYVPVGTIVVRKPHHEKSPRRRIKIADLNKWQYYSHYIWEKHNGKIPKGYLIHHKDKNPLNDNIENLEIMTRAEHLDEHRKEHNENKRSENMKKAWEVRRLRKDWGLPEKTEYNKRNRFENIST